MPFNFLISVLFHFVLSLFPFKDGRSNSPFRSRNRNSDSPTRRAESPTRYTGRNNYEIEPELQSSEVSVDNIGEKKIAKEMKKMRASTMTSLSGPPTQSLRQNIINKKHSLGSNRGSYQYNNWLDNTNNKNIKNKKVNLKESLMERESSPAVKQSESIISNTTKSEIKNTAPVRSFDRESSGISIGTGTPVSQPVSSLNSPKESPRPGTAPEQNKIKETTKSGHLKYSDLKYGKGIFNVTPHSSTGKNVLTPDNFITSSSVRKGRNVFVIFFPNNVQHF